MQLILLAGVVTVALGWWLARMDRDSALRPLAMAALAGSSLWLVWVLVDAAPLRHRAEPAWVTQPPPNKLQPEGFWARVGQPGLTAARMGVGLLVAAIALALWPLGQWGGRVLRTVLLVVVSLGSLWLMLGLGIVLLWSQSGAWTQWRGDLLVNLLTQVLCAVAIARQGVAERAPLVLGARKSERHGRDGRARRPE
jgi:hypothetical protein